MPSSPLPLCRDCLKRSTANGYCGDHQQQNNATMYRTFYDKYRADDPIRALYRHRRWQGTRRIVFRRDPLCMECGHRASTDCDHHPLTAREIVAAFGKDEFYNADRCR